MINTKSAIRNLVCSVGIVGTLMSVPRSTGAQSDFSFSKEFISQSADSTSAKTITCKVPESFGRLVEKHVDKIFREGYALTMEDKDFDHGHLLIRPKGSEKPQTLEELLSQTQLILYHTDEDVSRWKSSARPPYQRKQRSILGTKDGKIIPAIRYAGITDSTFTYPYMVEIYHDYGTVFSWDLTGKDKTLQDGQRYDDAILNPLNPLDSQLYCSSFSVDLVPEENGRFARGNKRYEIYMTLMPKKIFEQDSKMESLAKVKVDTTRVIDKILNFYKTEPLLTPYEFPRAQKNK